MVSLSWDHTYVFFSHKTPHLTSYLHGFICNLFSIYLYFPWSKHLQKRCSTFCALILHVSLFWKKQDLAWVLQMPTRGSEDSVKFWLSLLSKDASLQGYAFLGWPCFSSHTTGISIAWGKQQWPLFESLKLFPKNKIMFLTIFWKFYTLHPDNSHYSVFSGQPSALVTSSKPREGRGGGGGGG